jgi:hypothetical protein
MHKSVITAFALAIATSAFAQDKKLSDEYVRGFCYGWNLAVLEQRKAIDMLRGVVTTGVTGVISLTMVNTLQSTATLDGQQIDCATKSPEPKSETPKDQPTPE